MGRKHTSGTLHNQHIHHPLRVLFESTRSSHQPFSKCIQWLSPSAILVTPPWLLLHSQPHHLQWFLVGNCLCGVKIDCACFFSWAFFVSCNIMYLIIYHKYIWCYFLVIKSYSTDAPFQAPSPKTKFICLNFYNGFFCLCLWLTLANHCIFY